MADLEQNRGLIEQARLQLIIIGPADIGDASELLSQREMPFEVYVDSTGELFAAYELREGGMLANARQPGTYRSLISAVLGGARSGGVLGNTRQFPGTAIVDGDGQLRLHHTGRHAGDHMKVRDLLDAVVEIRQLDRNGSRSSTA